MITFQKGENPLAGGFLESKRQALHGANSTPADEKPLDTLRAELSRFGLAVRKVNPSGYYATCKQSTHFLRDFADMTALCDKIARGASNTIGNAGNLHDREVFSRPEFSGFGWDGSNRKADRTALSVLLTSHPPVARSKAASGSQSHNGAQTMPTIIIKRRTSVAPIATTSTELTAQARQRLQEAIGLLQGTPSEADTARALGRILTASRALKRVVGGAA